MNLAIIGSGGREHALCYKLRQSKEVKKIFCIPGNAGTKNLAENIEHDLKNFDGIYKIIKEKISILYWLVLRNRWLTVLWIFYQKIM